METNSVMDWILGGLAIAITVAGLWMLLSGIRSMGGKS
ncbi:NAD synthetase [Pannus brasiliensis]